MRRTIALLVVVLAGLAAAPSANAADKLVVCVGGTCSVQELPPGSATDAHRTAKAICAAMLPGGLDARVAGVCSYGPSFDSLGIVTTFGAAVGTEPSDDGGRIVVAIGTPPAP